MRALRYHRYGPASVLALEDAPAPLCPRGGVLVSVESAALNPKDVVVRSGRFVPFSGWRFPKTAGLDFAGRVVASRTPAFTEGQRVFGFLNTLTARRGTLAELVACAATEVAPLPESVRADDAAAVALAGLTALQALRDDAGLRPDQRILIHGASGGVGTLAVQIGRLLGARVETVTSAANVPLCAELGAHATWTYPEHAWRGAGPYDVIFDVFGTLNFAQSRAALTPRGRFVSTLPTIGRLARDLASRWAHQQARVVVVRPRRADFDTLSAWLSSGDLRAVIDSVFDLTDFGAAFARLESKRTRGKIVVRVAP